MNLYFGFFAAEIAKRTKIVLALLTGVTRAFQFAKRDEKDAVTEHMDQLYTARLVESKRFPVLLNLIYRTRPLRREHDAPEEFYQAAANDRHNGADTVPDRRPRPHRYVRFKIYRFDAIRLAKHLAVFVLGRIDFAELLNES